MVGSEILVSLFFFFFFSLLLVVLNIKTRQVLSDCLTYTLVKEQLNHSINSRHFEALKKTPPQELNCEWNS